MALPYVADGLKGKIAPPLADAIREVCPDDSQADTDEAIRQIVSETAVQK